APPHACAVEWNLHESAIGIMRRGCGMARVSRCAAATPSDSTPQTSPPMESKTQPIQQGHGPMVSEQVPATLVPEHGWHFLHLFYRVDRARLAGLPADDRQRGRAELCRILSREVPGGPQQLQCFAVPGHKADFGIVAAGSDLRAIHRMQMAVQSSTLG